MKCRVCGYDLDPNRAYCDMCGTKVIDPEEVSVPDDRPAEIPSTVEKEQFVQEEPSVPMEPIQTESYAHIPEEPNPWGPAAPPVSNLWNTASHSAPMVATPSAPSLPNSREPISAPVPEPTPAMPYEPPSWWTSEAAPAPAAQPDAPRMEPVQTAAYREPELEFYNEPMYVEPPMPETPTPVVAPQPPVQPVAPQPPVQPVAPPPPAQPVVQPAAQPSRPAAKSSEFSWNIYDFPQPKQPEDISIQWPEYDAAEAKAEINEPSEGRIREAMEKKQPVVMVSNDVSEGFIALPDGTDAAWKEPMAESTKQAERFFTFQKKNEEFQRLLDQEYEKLKSRKRGEDYREEQFRMPQEDMLAQRNAQRQATMQAQQARNMQGFVPSPMYRQPTPVSPVGYQAPPGPAFRAEDLNDFEQMLIENTKDADFVTGDTLPINLEKIQAEVRAQEEARLRQNQNQEAIRAQQEASNRQDQLEREAVLRAQMEKQAAAAVEMKAAETEQIHKSANRERLEAMAKAREDYFRSIGIEPEAAESAEVKSEEIAADVTEKTESMAEPPETEQAEQEVQSDDAEKPLEELFAPLDEVLNQEKKAKKKKHGFLKFLAVLLLLAGLAEVSVIGLRQFLPDHEITKTTTQIEQTVITEVTTRSLQFRDYVKSVLKGFGIELGTSEAPEDPLPEEEPVFNLGALVTVFNKNIKSVTESPKLGFDSTKVYEIEGLGDMETISDIETKEAVYSCLISFNSKWIDYVNDGEDKSCLELLKADGAAYRSTVNFPKVGQINETFDSLVLGEIRYNEEQYFTFVREQITIVEDETSTKRSYSWIYRLEDVAGDLKIVDYTSFE